MQYRYLVAKASGKNSTNWPADNDDIHHLSNDYLMVSEIRNRNKFFRKSNRSFEKLSSLLFVDNKIFKTKCR